MKRTASGNSLLRAVFVLVPGMLISPRVTACAVCFGRSDSPLAEGMNMGILTLLGVIVGVLAAFTAFFVFLGRRSAMVQHQSTPPDDSVAADS
ncbi:MAG: hypothetical protein KDM81_10040 [Verrucomicrobiae bacterium]|nr:hypothetical protein [Verrucomicrobiae bacterium]MCP5523017.1 hypothetical protein [Verrucomicrobiales bacterium]